MIKEKLKRGTFLYKLYLYYHLYIRYKIFYRNKKSFSQFGEDLFIEEFFKNHQIGKYVDLGSFHPMRLSNTYLLYKKGWSGTNVDFNEISIDMFNIVRKRDQNICCLVSDESNLEKKAYFHSNWGSGNTVVPDTDFNEVLKSEKIMKTRKFEELVNYNFDFLNIDLEGHDYAVLKTINLKKYKPELICIEILEKSLDKENIFSYMDINNYKFIKKCGVSFFFKKLK